jgi:hypothetical protein
MIEIFVWAIPGIISTAGQDGDLYVLIPYSKAGISNFL